jgi:tetratricopeptide (TPR) repeat protein
MRRYHPLILFLALVPGCAGLRGPFHGPNPVSEAFVDGMPRPVEELPSYFRQHGDGEASRLAHQGSLLRSASYFLPALAASAAYVSLVTSLPSDQKQSSLVYGWVLCLPILSLGNYGLKVLSNERLNASLREYGQYVSANRKVPDDPELLMRQGRFDEATIVLKHRLNFRPSAESYRDLAHCYVNLEDWDRALLAYRHALALDPEDEELKSMVTGLELKLNRAPGK